MRKPHDRRSFHNTFIISINIIIIIVIRIIIRLPSFMSYCQQYHECLLHNQQNVNVFINTEAHLLS